MKILLIEDDRNKRATIADAIKSRIQSHSIEERFSYQSGLAALIGGGFDLCLLDMSLPTFDISAVEDGFSFRHFGGLEILREMVRKNVRTKALVVTQFESFGEGRDAISLKLLDERLAAEFPSHYLGSVFYSASESAWRQKLDRVLDALEENA